VSFAEFLDIRFGPFAVLFTVLELIEKGFVRFYNSGELFFLRLFLA